MGVLAVTLATVFAGGLCSTGMAHAAARKVVPISPITIVKKAHKLPVWKVTIAGHVSGTAFSRKGVLALARTQTRVTTNGINPVDVCLVSGNPPAAPQPGAIYLDSNAACLGYRSKIDMGWVKVAKGTLTFTPDSRLGATYINVHTSSSSYIFACLYYPVTGSASYTFYSNGTVRGTIKYNGFGGAFCGWSGYVATVTGHRIQ
jgi:hypothetical protein